MTFSARVALLDHQAGAGPVVRITAGSGAVPIAELVAGLGPFVPGPGELYVDGQPLRRHDFLDEVGLRDGSVVSVGGPLRASIDGGRGPVGGAVLLVVGGPDAGRSVPLPPGVHDVGREAGVAVLLDDPEVSRAHVRLHVDPDGVRAEDLGSSNGTYVDGRRVEGATLLAPGVAVRIGRTTLAVATAEPADRALVPTADGSLAYNPRFRTARPTPPVEVEIPDPHEPEPPPAISLIYVALPALAGLLMAWRFGAQYLLFAIVGPLTALGGIYATRRQYGRREARRRAKADAELAAAQERLANGHRVEVAHRRERAPDLATLVLAAEGPRSRLWERRATDPDHLELRVGLADQPSAIALRGRTAPPPAVLPDLPVTVRLPEVGSIGIAGTGREAGGLAAALVFQVATLHSPSEVRLIVASQDPAWSWTRWLPHVRASATGEQRTVGVDATSIRARLDELEALVDQRLEARREGRAVLPRVVLLLDHPSRLDRRQVRKVLGDGPGVGVHAICLENVESELPEEFAGATVTWPSDRAVVRVRARATVAEVRSESLAPSIAEAAARFLAPLRPETTSTVSVPRSVRLLDLLGIDLADPGAVARAWRAGAGRCRAIVGIGASDAFVIELDDRLPHGLVAGASGAGKSEFLKTYLASLALAEDPDDLQILLIDFKGGLDYRTLARLPHIVDLVTNIDEGVGAVARALGLLEAEVERRQRLVSDHGARDLASYRDARRRDPGLPILGRLLVVADEFAEFASSHPDLLEKLVSVARVGRAVGVHLLLATQRPAGAITSQIQANVALRVCFRVNPGEADDVIGSSAPEAIATSTRGRAFVRAGDEGLAELQTARVAVARASAEVGGPELVVEVETWSSLAHGETAEVREPEVPDELTDLADVVAAAREAARQRGWVRSAVPWPRPLPTDLTFVPPTAVVRGPSGLPLVELGLRDDPRSQRHEAFSILLGGGHVGVVGGPGSGRTTLLRSVAAGMAYAAPPRLLHLHALDLGGGALRSLSALPSVGTVTDDLGLAARLVERLEQEVEARRERFSEAGWSNLAEQWAGEPASALPVLVLLVDGWEQLVASSSSSRTTTLSDRVAGLLARGGGVGVQGVVAGDRSVLGHQLARTIGTRLVLPLHELTDYQSLDVPTRAVPRPHLPGRALLLGRGGDPAEVQVHHLGCDVAGPTQVEALRVLGRHLGDRPRDGGAWRFAPLPRSVERSSIGGRPPGPGWVPVGVGGDEALPVWVDLGACRPGIAVAGPPSSGRSTALLSVATWCLEAGVPVILGTTRSSPLSTLATHPGVRASFDWTATRAEEVTEALGDGPVVVVVDDTEALDRRDPGLLAVLDAVPAGARLIAAGRTDEWRDAISGWLPVLRRSGRALLLTPRSALDGNAVGLARPLAPELVFARPPGRALWCADEVVEVVQVPLP